MALQIKEKYDARKVERLAQHLKLYHEKGQPIDYEIIVDGFKAVRRTNDPNMFSMYEDFVDADSKSMEILLYTGSSNNNDKTIYYFGEAPKEGGLSGIEIDTRIDEQVRLKLKEKEYEDLKKENAELSAEIDELEKQVEQLEKERTALLQSESPLKGVFGEIGSSLVESFIKRNPGVIKSIPGGEALAGLIETDSKRREDQEDAQGTDAEVSFKPKTSDNASLSENQQSAITFVDQLKTQFTKEEFESVLVILETLAADKTKIALILNHINIKSQ
jgi:hypothetical protein